MTSSFFISGVFDSGNKYDRKISAPATLETSPRKPKVIPVTPEVVPEVQKSSIRSPEKSDVEVKRRHKGCAFEFLN
jgi:hypothetical protein